jgi:DNA modification methylase
VDLIYLDPPFNSNRSYNVLFKGKSGDEAQAQIEAFDDTWTWSQQSEEQYLALVQGGAPIKVADAIQAMRELLGDNDVLAYLVMMTARLMELHRVLKSTGSLYLHCDPTASHYLKLMLDAIFGPMSFRNEIIWQRTNARSVRGYWPRVHDVLLFYGKGQTIAFDPLLIRADIRKMPHTLITGPEGQKYQTYELTAAEVRSPTTEAGSPWRGFDPTMLGRHWANAHGTMDSWEQAGLIHWPKGGGFPRRRDANPFKPEDRMVAVGDVWTDVDRINQAARERLGYPTQKPVALLERIIRASTNEGDVVLDPFCGCGTTIDAAQKLGRRWVGIDITFLAIDLIENRLRGTYGEDIKETYDVHGIPHDLDGARALFRDNPFDFERWAVALVDGQPNEKQVGDRGIDGVIRFPLDNNLRSVGRALVSVKGGGQLNPAMVRDLGGTVNQHRAEMGVFICLRSPTARMREVAQQSGTYVWPITGRSYPRIQIVTVEELLSGKRPDMPPALLPYLQAKKLVEDNQLSLGL